MNEAAARYHDASVRGLRNIDNREICSEREAEKDTLIQTLARESARRIVNGKIQEYINKK